jgi:hypothetical protein
MLTEVLERYEKVDEEDYIKRSLKKDKSTPIDLIQLQRKLRKKNHAQKSNMTEVPYHPKYKKRNSFNDYMFTQAKKDGVIQVKAFKKDKKKKTSSQIILSNEVHFRVRSSIKPSL